MNPLTWLWLAMCTWVAVLGADKPMLSAVVIVGAWMVARRFSVVLSTLAIAVPVAASLLLVHGLFGHWETALELALRAAALVATLMAAFSRFTVPELARALQATPLSPKLTYAMCSALQTLPMGERYASIYSEQARLLGLKGRVKYVAFPLVTRMLVHGSDRALSLQTQGIELGGARTVLRPVPVTAKDWVMWLVAPLATIAVCVWA